MKKYYFISILVALLLGNVFLSKAQVVISEDSTYVTPTGNVLLDIYSSTHNKGILIPRMTTTQRTAISVGTNDVGLTLFDTDTKTYWYWDGSQWVELSDKQTLSFNNSTGELSISNGNTVTIPLSSGGDNWGSQTVVTDGSTLSGDGTSANPLSVVGDLTDDQNLTNTYISTNTLYINIENGSGVSVDLSQFMDNTDQQTLSFNSSTNYLSISNGNSVDLSSLSISNDAWKLTGNSGTSSSNFIGTTDNVPLNFRINNQQSGLISQDNTAFGYLALQALSSGTDNVTIGDHAGYGITDGTNNVAIGVDALYCYGYSGGGSGGGDYNVAIGKYAMFNPYQTNKNTAIGGFAGSYLFNSGEDYNVFVGYGADVTSSSHVVSNSTAIGAYSEINEDDNDVDNATAIGYRASAKYSNTVVLGSINGINGATANTTVCIGTQDPQGYAANIIMGPRDGADEGAQITWLGAGSYPTWYTDVFDNNFRIFTNTADNTEVQIFNFGTGTNKLTLFGNNNTTFLTLNKGDNTLNIDFGDNFANESNSDGVVYFEVVGSESYVFGGHVMSDQDGGRKLGNSTHRWQEVWATNGTIQTSDINEKENIKDLNYGLDQIMKLHPITFRWKKFKNYNDFKIGFSAQELQKVIPEVVVQDKEHPNAELGVMYSDMIPVLVKAIQELKTENDNLKAQLKHYDEEINNLKEMINNK